MGDLNNVNIPPCYVTSRTRTNVYSSVFLIYFYHFCSNLNYVNDKLFVLWWTDSNCWQQTRKRLAEPDSLQPHKRRRAMDNQNADADESVEKGSALQDGIDKVLYIYLL